MSEPLAAAPPSRTPHEAAPQPAATQPAATPAATQPAASPAAPHAPRTVILVGNPNVGKSALFGALTGTYATVSNYPGTTVAVTRGRMRTFGASLAVLDTPGTSSLASTSEDEAVTRDVLRAERDAVVVQVLDAKNLRRGLLLTAELAQARVPLALALNMSDEARERGYAIDAGLLSRLLGVPVAQTIAVQRQGLQQLREAIAGAQPARASALRGASVTERLADVDALLAQVLRRSGAGRTGALAVRLDRLTTHRLFGLPILFAVLYACYLFVGVLGAQVGVDFLETSVFAHRLVPWLSRALSWVLPAGAVQEFLIGPAGLVTGRFGLFSMGLSYGLAIVLPIVASFFLAFSVLEDSGYLPRLAVMADRGLRVVGLNGKAVLPMVLGLGCGTMATMTARILETKKERVLVTLLLAVGVPCSAQLAVIFAMLAGVSAGAALWFVAVMAGVLILVGLLAARLIPGRSSEFVLELPPLRLPHAGNVLVKTVSRIEWYLREALPLFLIGTLVLWLLDRTGGLLLLERAAAPLVVGLLGLPRETAASFILGFLRRDYAAAGLFAHYAPLARAGAMTRSMEIEVVVALTTVTLFIPCIASFLVIWKERGARFALGVLAFIFPLSFGTGALVNALMRRFY